MSRAGLGWDNGDQELSFGHDKCLHEEMSRRQLAMVKYGVHRNSELRTKRSKDCVLRHSNSKGLRRQVTMRGRLVDKVTSKAGEKSKECGAKKCFKFCSNAGRLNKLTSEN